MCEMISVFIRPLFVLRIHFEGICTQVPAQFLVVQCAFSILVFATMDYIGCGKNGEDCEPSHSCFKHDHLKCSYFRRQFRLESKFKNNGDDEWANGSTCTSFQLGHLRFLQYFFFCVEHKRRISEWFLDEK